MNWFRKFVISVVILWLVFILGGFAHESDIRRQCMKQSHAGYAGWLGDFDCHVPSMHSKDNNHGG